MKISDKATAAIAKKLQQYGHAKDSHRALTDEISKHLSEYVEPDTFARELNWLFKENAEAAKAKFDEEAIINLITKTIEKIDEEHWLAMPMTFFDDENDYFYHTFCTDMNRNSFGAERDFTSPGYGVADPKFSEPGARQRGFLQLSERLAVLEPDEQEILKLERLANRRQIEQVDLPEATTFLCIRVKGYSASEERCPRFQSRYEALFKTVLLLAQWHSLGEMRPQWLSLGETRLENEYWRPDSRSSFVYDPLQKTGPKYECLVDKEISWALRNHGFGEWNFTVDEESDLVVAVGDIDNSKERFFYMHSTGIEKLIDNYESYIDLINAAQWCFDSARSTAKEPVKAFLFLGIAWDALLGSKGGSANVTSTLGDRLAYLISETRSEREEILASFKNFYQVRSKVVHGRLAWLDNEEIDSYSWGFKAFRKAFEKELELI